MSLFGKKYDPSVDLAPQQDRGFDHLNWVIQPGKAIAREPKMKSTHGGTIVVLPYPQFDVEGYRENNLVHPDRPPDSETEFGDQRWMFIAQGVRKFGKNPMTLLFDNPEDSGFSIREHHPIGLIVDTAWKAKKGQMVSTPLGTSDSDLWLDLLLGNNAKQNCYASLPGPDNLAIMNVMIYNLGTTEYPANMPLGGVKAEPQCVWVMSRSTSGEFLKTLRDKDGAPLPVTASRVYHFYDKQNPAGCKAKMNAEAASGMNEMSFGEDRRRAAPAQQGQGDKTLAGYGVFASDSLNGSPDDRRVPATMRDQIVKYSVQKLLPWEKILRGHTPDQCAQLVAKHCGLPHSLLYHAWQSHPKWYSEEMLFLLKRPSTMQMGGGSLPSQQGQQQAGRTTSEPPPNDATAFSGFGDDAPVPAAGSSAVGGANDRRGDFPLHGAGNPAPWGDPPAAGDGDAGDFDKQKFEEANNKFRQAVANRNSVSQ